MKRRTFVSLLAAALGSMGLSFPRREKPFRFFWADEDTEIFVARDLEALNSAFDFSEVLTPANEGELWGYVADDGIVTDGETGEQWTYRAYLDEIRDCDWFKRGQVAQVATCYA